MSCDREPIFGSIQPIGFLQALTLDWTVACASTNVAEFPDPFRGDLVGRPLDRTLFGGTRALWWSDMDLAGFLRI